MNGGEFPAPIATRLARRAPDQRAAATAPPGPVLCVAPAGSGKTTTVVARIAWRVKDNAYFEQSSVHRDLNQMALKAIKKFRFAPLPSDQAAVEQWGVITIVFRLN